MSDWMASKILAATASVARIVGLAGDAPALQKVFVNAIVTYA
jgi:hypothetical protein